MTLFQNLIIKLEVLGDGSDRRSALICTLSVEGTASTRCWVRQPYHRNHWDCIARLSDGFAEEAKFTALSEHFLLSLCKTEDLLHEFFSGILPLFLNQ